MKNIKNLILVLLFSSFFLTQACNKDFNPNRPTSAEEKRRKNIEEGRGASIGSILSNRGKTNYEFSSSNPMWRATLDTLDFLPLSTVDYSGGVIITDWYSENNNQESIKITLRFLSNEIRADALKIVVHKKNCLQNLQCKTVLLSSSKIKDELLSVILRKAALFEKSDKEKK
jgi:hypothetical protein|tara:strand:- start:3 stop:518 length:516 start_codon:yes stop_codon:yes gene_type:complete